MKAKLLISGLVVLLIIPVGGSMYRIIQMISGGPVTPDNARYFDLPWVLVIHAGGLSLFALLAVFQLATSMRRPTPRLHRVFGRVAAGAGISGALAGLWMVYAVPGQFAMQWPMDVARIIAASLILGFIAQGVCTAMRGSMGAHRRAMLRAMAVVFSAATQPFYYIPIMLIFGEPESGLAEALLFSSGWGINLIIVEWIIRRPLRNRALQAGEIYG
ncbi:DUF2306 domain-containing protein [Pelagovum sp. HNIBRBA483]|uniref:DUF2306 domain-containing protein n=1 Tax=Pelagovum sp. HNIBRBA483 TaxID=3233341 RepID=UPI0034A5D0E3